MLMGFGLTCGHCHHRLRIRTSKGQHVCLRILHLQCTNELCGATYRGFVEVDYQYSPSACPSPQFSLPSPPEQMRRADQELLYPTDNGGQLDLVDELGSEEGASQQQGASQ